RRRAQPAARTGRSQNHRVRRYVGTGPGGRGGCVTRTSAAWLFLACVPLFAALSYQSEITQWRSDREAGLKRDGGWLTVAGLFWLHPGDNPFGAGSSNEIALPAGPAHAGVFEVRDGKVFAKVNRSTRELRPDTDDLLQVDRVRLYVIRRGDRLGIRMKDP